MSFLVADCPRCGSQMITFDLMAENQVRIEHGWQRISEVFSRCRKCGKTTTFILSQKNGFSPQPSENLCSVTFGVNDIMEILGFISIKDNSTMPPPEHLPQAIKDAFEEGAKCAAVNCYNAAATMFRLCLDHATRSILPDQDVDGLNPNIRRSLGLRLRWLFEKKTLPDSLRELSSCVKEDGNDGAHAGTLTKLDMEDLSDFTVALLERLYTEPERLKLAKERREKRRT